MKAEVLVEELANTLTKERRWDGKPTLAEVNARALLEDLLYPLPEKQAKTLSKEPLK